MRSCFRFLLARRAWVLLAVLLALAIAPATLAHAPLAQTGDSPPIPPLRWAWRTLALLSAGALLGGPLFSSFVLGGASSAEVRSLAGPLGRRLAAMVSVCAALLLWSLMADMVYQVAAINGTDALAAFGNLGTARDVITGTGYGAYWALRVVAAFALLGYGAWRWRAPGRLDWTGGVLNGGIVFAGEALGSHEAAARPVLSLPLGMIGDLIHLLAAGAWVGGLLYIAVVLLPVLRRAEPAQAERLLGRVVPRFSNLAAISVVLLIVTGLANLAVHTLDPAAVLDNDYGRLLILKHLLFLPLIALGALNNRVVGPQLVTALLPGAPPSDGHAARRFRRTVTAQAVLATAVLLCAAGLTLLPPPLSVGAATQSAIPTPQSPLPTPPVPVKLEETVAGVRFGLTVLPDPAGDMFTVDLTRMDKQTAPLTDALKLQLLAIPQDTDSGSTSLPVNRVGPLDPDHQVYTATGQILILSGGYQINAEFLRTQGQDIYAGFRLTLADDGTLSIVRSDVLRALLTTQPNPPLVGFVTVTIKLIDGQEQPVPGARVLLTPLMPSHGHVELRGEATPVSGCPGAYSVQAHFTMGGPWLLIVEVDRPNQPPARTDASFDVTDPNATPTPPP
ncbi:MAG: DUF4149 domain-containing protein [Chloroflexia bacterium]